MPNSLNTKCIADLPILDQHLSDRCLRLSRFWLAGIIGKRYSRMIDSEQLANTTVFRLIRWANQRECSANSSPCQLDRVCRTIAKRVALQAIRDATRLKRRDSVAVVSLSDHSEEIHATRQLNPQLVVMEMEIFQMAFSYLSIQETNALTLRLEGWTIPEIGKEFGKSPQQIRRAFVLIRRKLSASLILGVRSWGGA